MWSIALAERGVIRTGFASEADAVQFLMRIFRKTEEQIRAAGYSFVQDRPPPAPAPGRARSKAPAS